MERQGELPIESTGAAGVVYVDDPVSIEGRDPATFRAGARHGHRWCHMWSDDLNALHVMAAKIGMRREWFQNREGFPHYDLVPTRRALAVKFGAVERPLRDYLRERRDRRTTNSTPA